MAKLIDKLVLMFVARLVVGLDLGCWAESFHKRVPIYWSYLLGIGLVLVIPFNFLGLLSTKLSIYNLLAITGIKNGINSASCFELWEIGAYLWTILYLAIFMCFELPDHSDKLEISGGKGLLLGLFGGIVYLVIALALLYAIIISDNAQDHILGEIVVALVLCYVDVKLRLTYAERKKYKEANSFAKLLTFIDIPLLLAFCVISVYLYINRANMGSWRLPFASGSAALNLILINTIFSVMYVSERYEHEVTSKLEQVIEGQKKEIDELKKPAPKKGRTK